MVCACIDHRAADINGVPCRGRNRFTIDALPGQLDAVEYDELDRYPDSIPTEIISEEQIQLRGHTRRLPQAEGDMHTVMVGNEDGTNSLYIFSYPVKYTDSGGRIRDKSNDLSAHEVMEYAYVNMENDIQTHFPNDITKDPLALTYGEYVIYSMPVSEAIASTVQRNQNDTVTYPSVFGEGTALRYQVDFNGYKEDIIVETETATTEFSFYLYCVGLEPTVQDAMIVYADSDSGEIVFTTSPFYIYDSSMQTNGYTDTDFTLTEMENSVYELTVDVDEDFLNTENLTYPIYVDPSLTFSGSSSVETITIYANSNTSHGSDLLSYIGYRNASYGEGRMLIRFTGLLNNVIFRNLPADQITDATLYMYASKMGTSSSTVRIRQFGGETNWDTDSTWAEVITSTNGTIQDGELLSAETGSCSFNIIKAIKTWVGDTSNSNNLMTAGLMVYNVKTTDDDYCRAFYTENGSPATSPYLSLTYTPVVEDGIYYIRNAENKSYANATEGSTSVSLKNFEAANTQKWQITQNSNGYYTIKSLNTQTYLGVSSLATNGTSSVISDATSTRGKQWAIIPSNDGRYILMANPVAAASNGTITHVLASSSASANSGILTQTYLNTTNLRDEWELYQCKYEYTLHHYYDQGYEIRYTDSTSTALEKIKNYHNVVAEQYLIRFNLEVIPKYFLFRSVADECKGTVTVDNLSTPCDHVMEHLSSTEIQIAFNRMGAWGTETCTTVFWTGHILKDNALSGSFSPVSYMIIITPATTTDDNYQNESTENIYTESIYMLLHETSHQLGAKDHYCAKGYHSLDDLIVSGYDLCDNTTCDICRNNSDPRACVMTDRYDGYPHCSDCISIIEEHLLDHHSKEEVAS